MKKILLSTVTLTLISGLTLGMQRQVAPVAPVATPAVAVAPAAQAPVVQTPAVQAPVVPVLAIKQATPLIDQNLIARLAAMKAIVEANESDLDKKVAQFEAFADNLDKFKKSSTFISPSEIAAINANIDETMKEIDAAIVSAQEWSLLPDGAQVAKLKEIKRRIHNKAKEYTGSWELSRTFSVYAHSYWKPTLTALVAATAIGIYNKRINSIK